MTATKPARLVERMLQVWIRSRSPALADAIQVADPDRWTGRFSTAARAKKGLARGYIERLPDDDPRITVFLIQCLHAARWPGPTAKPLWAQIFDKLMVLSDVRAVPTLRVVAKSPPPILGKAHATWLTKTLLSTATAIEAAQASRKGDGDREARELAAAWTASVPPSGFFGARVRARRVPASTKALDLVKTVFDNPRDEATRLVIGDALQELGDPWGEFIALQCGTGPGVKERERLAAALLKKNLERFAGPIAHIADRKTWVFEKGFLASCRLRGDHPKSRWEDGVATPYWATVREVQLAGAPSYWITEFAAAAPYRSAQRIGLADVDLWRPSPGDAFIVTSPGQRETVSEKRSFGFRGYGLKWLTAFARGLAPQARQSLGATTPNAAVRTAIAAADGER